MQRTIYALFAFILTVFTICTYVRAKEFHEFIKAGQKQVVWGVMCKSTYCNQNVCLKFANQDKSPARAIITIDATWRSSHEKEPVEATGEYCSPSKNMTYFMTYSVSVESPDKDIWVTFFESDDYKN